MQISLKQPSASQLTRLEAAAQKRPRLYRLRLMLLALIGDISLTFVRVLPLAVPIVVGVLLYDRELFYWAGGLAVVLLSWIVRPGTDDRGEELKRDQAPELFATLDSLNEHLNVGRRLQVRINDEVNASAREVRGLFGFLGTRRIITLGIPLLAILGKDETRAVIAHELGHFSRRHGRFGHWLYWAHMGWLAHADEVDAQSSILDRAGAGFAQLFLPVFNRRAMVWSRLCEFEADADAASVVGGKKLVSALTRLDIFSTWYEREFSVLVQDWQRQEPHAPSDYLERIATAFEQATPGAANSFREQEPRRGSDWLDTHPSLSDRAVALKLPVELLRFDETGAALFASRWPVVVSHFNCRWRKSHAVAWAVGHHQHKLIEEPLLLAADDTVAMWDLDKRLARARALRKSSPELGLDELHTLSKIAPSRPDIAFAYASALLTEGDAAGVDTMTGTATADASFQVPACVRLARFYERRKDRTNVERWTAQLEASGKRLEQTVNAVSDHVFAGNVLASSRPTEIAACLRAGLAADSAVAKAYFLESKAPLASNKKHVAATVRVDICVLIIDPFDDQQRAYDVDAIRAGHRQTLADLIEPNALPIVTSFYSTETLPPILQAVLDKMLSQSTYERGAAYSALSSEEIASSPN
jgi:Zn-dependent protease with chaperone function